MPNTDAEVATFHLHLFHNGTSGRTGCTASAAALGMSESIGYRGIRILELGMEVP